MNKSKISPKLTVSAQNNDNQVFVLPNNFDSTKRSLKEKHINFTPYRFAGCIHIKGKIDINSLASMQEISYITPNAFVQTCNDDLSCIHLEYLNGQKFYGKGRTICFIDTGIFPHADFVFPTSRIVKFVDFVNGHDFPYDDNGHGTFVAGTACGGGILDHSHVSPACQANIIMLKALDKNGLATSDKILKAMQWIYEYHKVYNIDIVCMSLGADSEEFDPLSNAAKALWEKGIVVVAAAGNGGPKSSTIKSPGICPSIITVGGIDQNTLTTVDFSSRGPTIFGHKPDLVAPAVELTSCGIGENIYTEMSGTSVAAPVIAGVCAALLSKYKLSNIEIKELLKQHCIPITHNVDIEGAGFLDLSSLH